jgi:hypothetical protein
LLSGKGGLFVRRQARLQGVVMEFVSEMSFARRYRFVFALFVAASLL